MSTDTLYEDPSGHGASLLQQLEREGFALVVRLLNQPADDWDSKMGYWGGAQLFAVEVLCAAGGQPSSSPACETLNAWAEENPCEVEADAIERMRAVIDCVVDWVRTEAKQLGLTEEDITTAMTHGEAMKRRIAKLR